MHCLPFRLERCAYQRIYNTGYQVGSVLRFHASYTIPHCVILVLSPKDICRHVSGSINIQERYRRYR